MDTQHQRPSDHYEQGLSRSLGILANISITLSAVTPAASVFVIVPLIITSVGTASISAMALAGIVGIFMALCWAELAAKFPVAGGDYSLVYHAFSRSSPSLAGAASFITFSMMLASVIFIPAVIALGTADALKAVWNVNPQVSGAVVTAGATLIAIMAVRQAAFVTGLFLAIEMLVLAVVTLLGLMNWQRSPLEFVTNPVVGAADGLEPVALGSLFALTAVAVFAYNAYNFPIFYSEETQGDGRRIAKAILVALVITVLAEIIPLFAILVGSPSIEELTTSEQGPLTYFLLASSSPMVNMIIAIGITLAIFNAVIACIATFGRILFATGRDKAWPGATSDWIAWIHPATKSPVIATGLVGLIGVVLCLTVSLNTLITLTGASLVLNYAMVALAALVARANGATKDSPYQMPLWPIPPLIALGALFYITLEQSLIAWGVTGMTALIGLAYYVIYLWPRRGRAWRMLMPVAYDGKDGGEPPASAAKVADNV
jgi:amino acid transporter